MLTAFLSGPLTARTRLNAAANDLRAVGWHVASRWLDDTTHLTPGLLGPATDLEDQAADNITRAAFKDIEQADVLVAFTATAALDPAERTAALAAAAHAHLVGANPGHLPGASGGRHVEVGYAVGIGRTVLLVGQLENLFHRSPLVERHPDWHTTLTALAGRLVEHERSRTKEAHSALVDVALALQATQRLALALGAFSEEDLLAEEREAAARR